jgi:hypothetical protein
MLGAQHMARCCRTDATASPKAEAVVVSGGLTQ